MRAAITLSALLLAAALLLTVAGIGVAPIDRTCALTVDPDLCDPTVDAALERGLGALHPLILAAHVEPGPAAGPTLTGHEATVSFDLLGIPDATDVRMFTDMGGHWGGAVSRSDTEVAMWALAPLLLAGLLSVAMLSLTWRHRSPTTG